MARSSTISSAPSSVVDTGLWRRAKPLPPSFYLRDTASVARDLIGKCLVIGLGKTLTVAQVVEVEAYLGSADPASHAFRGLTPRNWAMFEAGGTCYVYRSYGIHLCMNVATGKKGVGEAVLFRAAAPLLDLPGIAKRRGFATFAGKERLLLSGPGRLTQGLGITGDHNGRSFDRPDFKLVAGGPEIGTALRSGPRIGITKAMELPLRFRLSASPWLSRPEAG